MRILVATDAWRPQVNGVVRSLEALERSLRQQGVDIDFLTPQDFRSFPLPGYREISLALAWPSLVRRRIEAGYDHIHIATEGPIGQVVRSICLRDGVCFTTSFHTLFPEYIQARCGLPPSIGYAALRRFHNAGAGTMVSTPSLARHLDGRGFRRLLRWSRGVDHTLFSPKKAAPLDLPRPIFLYAGRVSVEKNLEAFLRLDLPGSKVIVGDGPVASKLKALFPQAHFPGVKTAEELAPLYAAADVFVFPSRTDTFGMVLLEALACGLPFAAYPVMGPLDVIGSSGAGVLDEDLQVAALSALDISRDCARSRALSFNWDDCARQFIDNVAYAHGAITLGSVSVEPWLSRVELTGRRRSAPT